MSKIDQEELDKAWGALIEQMLDMFCPKKEEEVNNAD